MKKLILLPIVILILMVFIFSFVLVANYVLYKTWGNNEDYYLSQDGFPVKCDYTPLQKPTNCRAIIP